MMPAYRLMTSVLPFAALVVVSLQPFWTSAIDVGALTLRHYGRLFADDFSRNALRNSILLGIAGATAGTLIASVIAFHIVRRRASALSRIVDGRKQLAGAVAQLIRLTFAGPPFHLSGTIVLLFLAHVVLHMPQTTFSATAALAEVGRE